MKGEVQPQGNIEVSKKQFRKALRITIIERLLLTGEDPSEKNIRKYTKKSKENWITVTGGRQIPEWHLVLKDASRLSLDIASGKRNVGQN